MAERAPHKPVYLVCGQRDDRSAPRRDGKFQSDAYLKREAVRQITRIVLGDGDDADAPIRYDGPEADLADVLDDVRTYSLLGETRLVIVDEADAFITRHRQKLEAYCASPSTTGVLVLVCATSNANTRLHKAIAALGGVIACRTPVGRELIAWIVRQARERYGKQIEAAGAAALHESCDDYLGTLDAELAKLAAYVGDRQRITADDVHALVGRNREQLVFAVTKAMAEGDTAGALDAWEQTVATDRAAPMRAVGGLAWSVRQMLARCREGDDANARRLEDQLTDLLQLDLDAKTGLADVSRGVEKFIVRNSARIAAG